MWQPKIRNTADEKVDSFMNDKKLHALLEKYSIIMTGVEITRSRFEFCPNDFKISFTQIIKISRDE